MKLVKDEYFRKDLTDRLNKYVIKQGSLLYFKLVEDVAKKKRMLRNYSFI